MALRRGWRLGPAAGPLPAAGSFTFRPVASGFSRTCWRRSRRSTPARRAALLLVVRVRATWNRPRAGVEILLDALASADDPLGKISRDGAVFLALRAERVGQHVVAFVAFVRQQDVSGRRRQRQRNGERLDVGVRVVDVHLVAQFVLV